MKTRVGGYALSYELPPDVDEMAMSHLSRAQLQVLTKSYYDALISIAEIECYDTQGKKKSVSCFDDPKIECEHNYARQVLTENPLPTSSYSEKKLQGASAKAPAENEVVEDSSIEGESPSDEVHEIHSYEHESEA